MPTDDPAETIHVTTDDQLRAVSNRTRHPIMAVLRFEPATITQIAERVGLAKGSSSYHVRLLERAGLVKVVRTRKVRGVTERYYAMAARAIALPDPGEGGPDVLMRHAVADLEASPVDERHVRMAHLRLTEEQFAQLGARLQALADEYQELSDPSHCSTRHRASRPRGAPSDLRRSEVADRVRTAVDCADGVLAR
jgi:DNA-binding transcriptional ArsR family regulator